jgi:hypothetical protein
MTRCLRGGNVGMCSTWNTPDPPGRRRIAQRAIGTRGYAATGQRGSSSASQRPADSASSTPNARLLGGRTAGSRRRSPAQVRRLAASGTSMPGIGVLRMSRTAPRCRCGLSLEHEGSAVGEWVVPRTIERSLVARSGTGVWHAHQASESHIRERRRVTVSSATMHAGSNPLAPSRSQPAGVSTRLLPPSTRSSLQAPAPSATDSAAIPTIQPTPPSPLPPTPSPPRRVRRATHASRLVGGPPSAPVRQPGSDAHRSTEPGRRVGAADESASSRAPALQMPGCAAAQAHWTSAAAITSDGSAPALRASPVPQSLLPTVAPGGTSLSPTISTRSPCGRDAVASPRLVSDCLLSRLPEADPATAASRTELERRSGGTGCSAVRQAGRVRSVLCAEVVAEQPRPHPVRQLQTHSRTRQWSGRAGDGRRAPRTPHTPPGAPLRAVHGPQSQAWPRAPWRRSRPSAGGHRAPAPRHAEPHAHRLGSERQVALRAQNSGRLAGTPSRRGYASGHGASSTNDR